MSATVLKEAGVYSETEDAAKINTARREAAHFLQVLLAASDLNVVSSYTETSWETTHGYRNITGDVWFALSWDHLTGINSQFFFLLHLKTISNNLCCHTAHVKICFFRSRTLRKNVLSNRKSLKEQDTRLSSASRSSKRGRTCCAVWRRWVFPTILTYLLMIFSTFSEPYLFIPGSYGAALHN